MLYIIYVNLKIKNLAFIKMYGDKNVTKYATEYKIIKCR